MRITRSGTLGLLLTGVLLATGCSGLFPEPPPTLPPAEPFGDFAVGEFGGIDGRQNILRVRPDGTAVLISRQPAAGRLSAETLARLRELLTSEQFRAEVASQAEHRRDPARCADLITTEVRMGSLALSRTDPCGEEDRPDVPTFDEILTLVASERRGTFSVPLGESGPRLEPVRLERTNGHGRTGYVINVDANGSGTYAPEGEASRTAQLSADQRDALRLVLPYISAASSAPCNSTAFYRIRIGSGELRPDCSLVRNSPEIRAVVALLEDAFGV